jgi:hypothetical protein
VVILGGRGSGAIVAESVHTLAAGGTNLRVVGFLNDMLPRGKLVSGVPVIGPFASWRELPDETVFVAPLVSSATGPISRPAQRSRMTSLSSQWRLECLQAQLALR